jgi:hypothetical protein
VVQWENALHAHGAPEGMPYWDWTKPVTHVPAFLSDETYNNQPNPFYKANIDFENVDTSRYINQRLFTDGSAWLYENVMLALEQEDFCDFEVAIA